MRYLKLRYEDRDRLFEALRKYGEIYGPVKISKKTYDFRKVSRFDDMDLNYVRTISPPKKFVYPPHEVMFEIDREKGKVSIPEEDMGPIVLFGLHHCDIEGLKRLDSVFMGYPADFYYSRRRKHLFIVGYDCKPDEFCACNVTHTSFSTDGFDIFLHPLPDGWLVRVLSERGQALADEIGMEDASTDDFKAFERYQEERRQGFKWDMDAYVLRGVLEMHRHSDVWEELSEECLACGNCNTTCPTCRCYEVRDIPSIDGVHAIQERVWDSCQFEHHALVAGGHNFRPTVADRMKNRYNCKISPAYGTTLSYCVGCGRCTAFCPAGINFWENLQKLSEVSKHAK